MIIEEQLIRKGEMDFVFDILTRICLFVGWNYWVNVHETWKEDGSQPTKRLFSVVYVYTNDTYVLIWIFLVGELKEKACCHSVKYKRITKSKI